MPTSSSECTSSSGTAGSFAGRRRESTKASAVSACRVTSPTAPRAPSTLNIAGPAEQLVVRHALSSRA
jgi:hypothetical protein